MGAAAQRTSLSGPVSLDAICFYAARRCGISLEEHKMTSTEVLANLELALSTGNNSGNFREVEDSAQYVPRTPGFRTGAIRPHGVGWVDDHEI